VDSVAEKALISHGLIPHRWASPYLDILIVQADHRLNQISTLWKVNKESNHIEPKMGVLDYAQAIWGTI